MIKNDATCIWVWDYRIDSEGVYNGGARAGSVSSDCQYQQDYEAFHSPDGEDLEGRKGVRSGVCFRVHCLHYERVGIVIGEMSV